jgi:two-component system LytT family response regulator
MQTSIKAILVDDEEKSRKVLRSLLEKFHTDVTILGEAGDVDSALHLVTEKKPELVFLDIQMPGGNGFWLLKQWETLPFNVIFITSFDQYAIDAIKYSALDYILKPVSVLELGIAIKKAFHTIESKSSKQPQIVTLLNNLDNEIQEKKIAVHIQDKVKLLNLSQIIYIEADNTYSIIKTINGEQYVTSKPIKEYEELLSSNENFLRIHKSYLINLRNIKEYTKGEPCNVIMIDNKQFEVARRKKQEMLLRLRKNI